MGCAPSASKVPSAHGSRETHPLSVGSTGKGSRWRAALMAGMLGEPALERLNRQPALALFVSR